ncbi:GYD domain-containing protein [Geodermatophilus marinus]|uniref:GYD domain-containing protein n=1 Tax=Geodermatophilus sp. LHW52908 TaxID=2303986 RepID=UPI000E3D08DF|nr:GYD domain-containing protein [Geodermatophilus sp. LHW52908]RFU20846.1 GYD domain-containing protein [Geodermatophilus sp. LHW52908]
MPRFLVIAAYSPQGARAVMAGGGSARRSVFEHAVLDLHGRLETFDFALGEADVYALVELPDAAAAAALSLTISGGGVASVRTVVLLSPEDVDRAAQLHPHYPGAG